MDAFNRLFVVALGLATLVVSVVAALVVTGAVEPSGVTPAGWLRDQADRLAALDGRDQGLALLWIALAAVAGLALLLLEVRTLMGRRHPLTLEDTAGERFTLAADSLERVIEYTACRVEGVHEARPEVHNGRRGLRVDCRATVQHDASVEEVGATLKTRIEDIVRHTTGLEVQGVDLHLEYATPEKGRRVI